MKEEYLYKTNKEYERNIFVQNKVKEYERKIFVKNNVKEYERKMCTKQIRNMKGKYLYKTFESGGGTEQCTILASRHLI